MEQIRNILMAQHEEIANDLRAMRSRLHPMLVEVEAEEIWQVMDLFLRKLAVHLTLEEELLYGRPQETREDVTSLRQLAEELKRHALRFMGEWREARQLENEADRFVAEANGLFDALEERIRRENLLLAPLFQVLNGGDSS